MNSSSNQNWHDRLKAATMDFQNSFSDLSAEALNWQANSDQWSIGQQVDHLITTNRQYYPIFDQVLAGTYPTRFYEKLPVLPSMFGKLILKSVHPDTKRKTPTVPVFEPSSSEIPRSIFQTFEKEQNHLAGYIDKLSSQEFQSIIITSPASRLVIYSVKSALDIIVAHEERHLLQSKQVYNLQKQQSV